MNSRKTWKLLSAMPNKTRQKFGPWLAGELNGRTPQVLKLFQVLEPHLDEVQIPLWQTIWEVAEPENANNYARFRKTATELSQSILLFLSIEQFRSNQSSVEVHTLRALRQMGFAEEIFENTYKKYDKNLTKIKNKDAVYYRNRFEMELEFNQLTKGGSDNRMSTISDAFDAWWIQEKMQLGPIFQAKGLKPSFLWDETSSKLQELPDYNQWWDLHINEGIYDLMMNEKGDVSILLQQLDERKKALTAERREDIFRMLSIHYVRAIAQHPSTFLFEGALTLYEWGIREGIMLNNGKLDSRDYVNMINLTIKLKDESKTLQYFDELTPLLPFSDRKHTYIYARSLFDFSIGDFGAVPAALSNQKFQQPVRDLSARIKCWFAQYEYARQKNLWPTDQKWLLQQANTLIVFIRQKAKLSNHIRDAVLSPVLLVRRMIAATTANRLRNLSKRVNNEAPFTYSDWLAVKIQERMDKDFQEEL